MIKQYVDVFNGDADGLCALIQLRRHEPQCSRLVTGVKRDINLLQRVSANKETHVTVLDISFEKNAKDVERLLAHGMSIDYFDHHKTGELFTHGNLTTHIDLSAHTCTSLIVDKYLQGKYRAWALTAAYGDNLAEEATQLGIESCYSELNLDLLQKLGIYLNYNGYGANIDDLFFDPAVLYKKLVLFDSPFEFLEQDKETFQILECGYQQDMKKAAQAPLREYGDKVAIVMFPDEPWARRVSGVFGNELANTYRDRAHAIITQAESHDLVSIRAPLNRKQGADVLASKFPTGGGRKAAAGINALAKDKLKQFIVAMQDQFA